MPRGHPASLFSLHLIRQTERSRIEGRFARVSKKSASFAPCSAKCSKFVISFFFNLKTKKADCVAVFIKGQLWNKICFCTFFDFLSFTRKDQLFFLQIGGSNSVSYKVPYSILIVLIKNL